MQASHSVICKVNNYPFTHNQCVNHRHLHLVQISVYEALCFCLIFKASPRSLHKSLKNHKKWEEIESLSFMSSLFEVRFVAVREDSGDLGLRKTMQHQKSSMTL